MKHTFCLYFLVCVFLSAFFNVTAQDTSEPKEVNNIVEPELDLTISPIWQKYCSKSKMLSRLKLTFVNGGKESIILYKNSSIIGEEVILKVSNKSSEKPLKIIPLLNISRIIKFREAPEISNFVIIKSSESFSFEIGHVILINDSDINLKGEIKSGVYSLKIRVITWYYHPNIKDEYRTKWQNDGYLWTKDVTSSPMEFTIKKPDERIIENCK
jgi:hypothetical protein